nr:hypothetical protein CFP56_66501 [Quercus suber]
MRICRLIYPLPDVQLTRSWPLEVLALGISRAGTESLRNALVELGYEDVHHGVRFILSDQERLQWLRLAWAQHTNNSAGLTTAEFDKVLGDCAAVTDNPSCGFAHELLTAYPEAKVILNYRDDIDQWYESMMELEKLGREQTWRSYILSWFQSDLFWQQHVATYWLRGRHVPGGFRKNGKKWYAQHYSSLEERLTKEGNLSAKFLDKKQLSPPFPSSAMPREYQHSMNKIVIARRKQAEDNLELFIYLATRVLEILAGIFLYCANLVSPGVVSARQSSNRLEVRTRSYFETNIPDPARQARIHNPIGLLRNTNTVTRLVVPSDQDTGAQLLECMHQAQLNAFVF